MKAHAEKMSHAKRLLQQATSMGGADCLKLLQEQPELADDICELRDELHKNIRDLLITLPDDIEDTPDHDEAADA